MRKPLLVLSLLVLSTTQSPAQPAFFDQIDIMVDSYARQDLFSGAVLVAYDGEVFSRGYGQANRTWDLPNTVDTRYQVASLTQTFTAILIMRLHERGSLRLDDPLYRFMPDFPADYGADVTIHHLLSHTSGIPNYTDYSDWADTTSRLDSTPGDFVDYIARANLEFAPGSGFGYSNSNYYLLGVIIERITGMSYSRVLEELITGPGRLENTGYIFEHMVVDRLAEGYDRLSTGFYEKAPFQSLSTAYSASGIYSDLNDLYRLSQLLEGDRLLTAAGRERMLSPVASNYGYGWVIGEVFPREAASFFKEPFTYNAPLDSTPGSYRLEWQWGRNPGFNTIFVRVPGQQWTIIILENQHLTGDPVGTKIFDMAGQILERLHRNREG